MTRRSLGQRFWTASVIAVLAVACAPGDGRSGGVEPGRGPSTSGRVAGDGSIPGNGSISLDDSAHPALANLDPALLAAVRKAAVDARARGVELRVTSGWRSREYQQRLLDEAIARYRSEEEARRWVQPPEKSNHVTGKAIDIGPTDAADWLVRFGAEHGLCQAYANEMWHFELLTTPGGRCPLPSTEPTG
ncbi:M15 family metallopeptidase [Lentzea sp. NPDC060358]|uniref:M15 family metallopeptidase n=1 Tax=Lentzea sp. NPDC060358 TaxID=3347103 RepID=UPI00365A8380